MRALPHLLAEWLVRHRVGWPPNIPPTTDRTDHGAAGPDRDRRSTTAPWMAIIPGPDFRRGGQILGRRGIRDT